MHKWTIFFLLQIKSKNKNKIKKKNPKEDKKFKYFVVFILKLHVNKINII